MKISCAKFPETFNITLQKSWLRRINDGRLVIEIYLVSGGGASLMMDLVHETNELLLHSFLFRQLSFLGLLEGVHERAVLSPQVLHKPHQIFTHTL